MYRPIAASLCALALAAVAAAQTPVAQGGSSLTEVIVDPSASPAVHHAADELSSYLSQITGASIPVVPTSSPDPNGIVVGPGLLTTQLCPDIPWDKLAPEELVLRSTMGGLVVAGGSDRGTLYAVYRLLAREGVRWWTPWASSVPSKRDLTIGHLDIREKPGLEYRAPFWHSAFDPDWAVRNGSNYAGNGMKGIHGGGVEYAEFVHTYYHLVPPDPNFKLHPEWYSQINGKRTTDNAQLCTTDPDLRAYMLEQVKKDLRANPTATIISVSQNDCFNPCQCDRCRELVKEEGSESALVLSLANYVADGIAGEFPNVAVDTLAYQWSRHAPKQMKPRPNVIVRLCSIECNFGQPLDSKKNASFRDDVLAWSKLTDRLYVWDYVTNFVNYVQPMPDEAVLGPNVKFLASHGVKGIFEEGDYTSNGAGMSELKAWLLAQLLWDPNADAKALTREFLAGYYGAAAKPIGAYLALMDRESAATMAYCGQDSNAPFLSYQMLTESERLWTKAEAAVAGDPDRLWRVKQGHQAIRYVFLKRWDELRKTARDKGDAWLLPESKTEAEQDWLATVTGPGPAGWTPVTAVNESGTSPADFLKSLG
jgi:hypothetical protein